MSILWADDPSFYSTALIGSRYSAFGSQLTVAAGRGRFGGNAWSSSASTASTLNYVRAPLPSSIATGTIAVSFKLNTLPGATNLPILAFYDSGTVQIDLRINSLGNLLVTRNGTQIGSTSTSALSVGVWYRIEFGATINNTTGNIEARVEGSSTGWIPSTGSLNTRNTANNTFNQAVFGGVSGSNAGLSGIYEDFGDFLVTDSNSPNAGFLGDKRCFLRQPVADSSVTWTNTWASFLNSHAYVLGESFKDSNGNIQETTTPGTSASSGTPTWATTGGLTTTSGGATFTVVGSGSNPGAHNWMAVQEEPADDDSSYNLDSTPGDIDLFTLASLPAGAQNIAAVVNVIRARKDDAGTRTIQNWISSGGTTAGATNLTLSTSYVFNDFIEETDPHTSSAWTVSGANSLLVGYKEIA